MRIRSIILAVLLPASALAASPVWLQGWTAAQPATSGYTFPTNGLCLRFEFASATTTNNLATGESTNNCAIVSGRGTTVVLGEGLVTTNATGNTATWALTELLSSPVTTDKITVNAWVKWKTLADRDTLLYGNSLIMRQSGTNGDFAFYLYGVPTLLTASNVCTTSAWQMLTLVYDKTNQMVYKNGALVASAAGSIDIVNNTTPKLGSDGSSDTAQFSLDSLSVWSTALSPTEITNHFTGTKGTKL